MLLYFSVAVAQKQRKHKSSQIHTYSFSHKVYDSLLQVNVRNGEPYYKGFDTPVFYVYCDSLAKRAIVSIPKNERESFWLNAVNTCVIRAVLSRLGMRSLANYPDFFTKDTFVICGIKKNIKGFIDTLFTIHPNPMLCFGIHNGTAGFPSLYNRAFTKKNCYNSLKSKARSFIRSDNGILLDMRAKVLSVSTFFRDFAFLWRNDIKKCIENVRQFMLPDTENYCTVNAETLTINYLPEQPVLISRKTAPNLLKIKEYQE